MPDKDELDLCGILESLDDIKDELSSALESFELMFSDLESAFDDVHDELETIKDNVEWCTRQYQRYKRKIGLRIAEAGNTVDQHT